MQASRNRGHVANSCTYPLFRLCSSLRGIVTEVRCLVFLWWSDVGSYWHLSWKSKASSCLPGRGFLGITLREWLKTHQADVLVGVLVCHLESNPEHSYLPLVFAPHRQSGNTVEWKLTCIELLPDAQTSPLKDVMKGGCLVAYLSHLVYPLLLKIASSQRDACSALLWPT